MRTRDWHPKNHISFQENNQGTFLFETVRIKDTGVDQVMWPVHCVQGTDGAKYHKDLIVKDTDIEISKGIKSKHDAFSAFGSDQEDTLLYKLLKELDIKKVYVVGLAYDFCVGYTAEDSAEEGFETYVIKDATRSVDPDDEDFMNERLEDAGVKIINVKDLKN